MNMQAASAGGTSARVPDADLRGRRRTRMDAVEPPEALDLHTIAELSDEVVARMTRDELVRVICAGGVPLASDFNAERLRLQHRNMLQRLAYLARHACRNRIRQQQSTLGRRSLQSDRL